MTLEQRAIQAAKEAIEHLKPHLPGILANTKCSRLRFIYEFDGVYELMDYFIKERKWVISYTVGKGEGIHFIGTAGYFDKVETRKVELIV